MENVETFRLARRVAPSTLPPAVFLALLLLFPGVARAQASLAGVVKDTSGAVMPGVTVEVTSPALIEKSRTAVTDGSGQYKILDLRPGTYTITFTLMGFNTTKRTGVELAGALTTNISAEMRVGDLAETVTVTGETPLVDLQNATKERVLTQEVITAIPTGMNHQNLAALVPGVIIAGSSGSVSGIAQDVGGSAGDEHAQLAVHGSRGADQRFTIGGITFGEGNGQTHGMGPNVANMQEVAVDTAAVDATQAQGGVRINFIPKDGGNSFKGSGFFSGATEGMQGNNLTQELKDRGATSGTRVKSLYDVTPTLGGPLVRDRLWFFASTRRNVVQDWTANRYSNLNLGAPGLGWTTYAPDLSKPAFTVGTFRYASVRMTLQATPRNKVALAYDFRDRCVCTEPGGPETSTNVIFNPFHLTTATWSSPVTNRLLLDGGVVWLNALRRHRAVLDVPLMNPLITESNPLPGYPATYNGTTSPLTDKFPTVNSRFTMSYVTGSHALQAGIQIGIGEDNVVNLEHGIAYALTNGSPTQFTIQANPTPTLNNLNADMGIYVQDKWTLKRLTLSGGLRFDYLNTSSPEQVIGPTTYTPNRNITFPATPLLAWKDISPKSSVVYDVFGNGRTAIKGSFNRYLSTQGAGGPGNPAATLVTSASRAWTDGNHNFVPDCNFLNPALQDFRSTGGDLCGAFTGNAVNFGSTIPATAVDADTKFGWFKRSYNWEVSAGVQHALTQRVSLDVSYFRRWYGNFTATVNRALVASDFNAFSVVAPVDQRLPNGGGYTVSGFTNINPTKASAATDNFTTFTSNYGNQYEHWNGFDATVNVRLPRGVIFQGGTSTGRTSTDNCDVIANAPSLGVLNTPYCHQDTAFLTQVKALGSYTVPRVDLQFSATFQSIPGPALAANVVYTSAQIAQTLGRPLSGNAANASINVIAPGTLYGDRLNQTDLRFAKILRFGPRRATLSADLYNLFNANAVVNESSTYSQWRTPTGIMGPRLLKLTAQVDF